MEATAADIYVSSSCFYFATRKDEHKVRKHGVRIFSGIAGVRRTEQFRPGLG